MEVQQVAVVRAAARPLYLSLLLVVFSRKGSARKILGLVTDDPELSAAGLIQTDDRWWTIEPWVKDLQQRLGLGQYQHRPDRAAVIHLI
jgi:hypothetical protein